VLLNVKCLDATHSFPRLGTPQGDIGDVFTYDLSDQANAVQLNVANPSATPTPAPNIAYDANGNRS